MLRLFIGLKSDGNMQLNQVTVGNDRYRTVNGIKNKSSRNMLKNDLKQK